MCRIIAVDNSVDEFFMHVTIKERSPRQPDAGSSNSLTNHVNILEIETALKNEDESPPELAKYETVLAGYYSYYAQMLKRILVDKPVAWLNIQSFIDYETERSVTREKPLSDKKTEMIWQATEQGQAEIALSWELRRIEKMMSAINKRLYVDSVAAKNQY